MNMNFRRRIEALENRSAEAGNPVVLYMPDWNVVRIFGDQKWADKLICAERSGSATPEQKRQLDLIARCERADQPEGVNLIEAVWMLQAAE